MRFTPDQLADREAIREVATRYSRGVDRLDGECMKSAYWPDGTDDHGVFVGNAWEFVDHCMVSHLRWRSTMHCIFNHHIELDADGLHARGEVYNVTHLFRREEPVQETWYGRYLDQYEQRDGEWRILHRVCVYEGSRTDDASEMAIPWQSFRPGSLDRPSAGRPVGT
jgi:hypothetical protein